MHGPAEISLRREAFAGQKMMSTPTVFKSWGRQRPDMFYIKPMAREESAMNDNEQRPVTIITGRVWGAYFIVGGILILAGAFCWVMRSSRSDEPTS